MFGWLRRLRERVGEWAYERVLAENRAWKARWREEHGDEPFPLTPEEQQRLKEKRDRLTPEESKEIWSEDDDRLFGFDDKPPGADY